MSEPKLQYSATDTGGTRVTDGETERTYPLPYREEYNELLRLDWKRAQASRLLNERMLAGAYNDPETGQFNPDNRSYLLMTGIVVAITQMIWAEVKNAGLPAGTLV